MTLINLDRKSLYSVVIVGSGPAGSTMAYELAKRGVDVALLESAKLPRYKLCGGGVTWRAARQLPFGIEPVIQKTLCELTLAYQGKPKLVLKHDQPLFYTTMRDELDFFLVDKAREQGATILDGQSVRAIQESGRGFRVETQSDIFQCKVLVGADGANSTIAHALGLRRNPILGLGLEAEIRVDYDPMTRGKDSAFVDLGGIAGGYAWIFPKKDHLTVGVAGEVPADAVRKYYAKFVTRQLGPAKIGIRPKGHFMPLRKSNMPIQFGHALLVGDAAGLIDPFTGEGIFYAIKSAQMGAGEVFKLLSGKAQDLSRYETSVDEELMPDLATARLLSTILSKMPRFSIFFLARNKKYQRALCEVIRGEQKLSDVAGQLGPFKDLFFMARRAALPAQ